MDKKEDSASPLQSEESDGHSSKVSSSPQVMLKQRKL